jgi:hypothetical protein
MAQQKESSLSPDDTGLINPLVSQLSVEPYVDMDTGFANGYVVGDSHTVQGSISPLSDIYIVPSVVKYVESLLFPWRHSNEMTLLWI